MFKHPVRGAALVVTAFTLLLTLSLGCFKESPANDRAVAVSAVTALVDSHVQSMAGALQALAQTGDVKSGNWDTMKDPLSKLSQGQVPAAIWYALPDGSYYTVEQGKTDQNISDRPYFPKVMAGNMAIGDLVVSKSTGKKSVVAVAPVKSGGKVTGAVGASMYLDTLSQTIASELQLPEGMTFYAVAPSGDMALHPDASKIMTKAADFNSKSFSDAVSNMLAKKSGDATYDLDGSSYSVQFRTSSLTGWCVVLGAKKK